MLDDRDILANLITLDSQFCAATNAQEANFCAKLAVLECCGWIEEAMDEIVKKLYLRVLVDTSNHQACAESVKRNYGFSYDLHLKRMLSVVIGLTGIEKLERRLDSGKLAMLISALTTLKTIRDTHAHTYLKGAIPTLAAPSVIRSQFTFVQAGLRDIDMRIAERTW